MAGLFLLAYLAAGAIIAVPIVAKLTGRTVIEMLAEDDDEYYFD